VKQAFAPLKKYLSIFLQLIHYPVIISNNSIFQILQTCDLLLLREKGVTLQFLRL